MESLPNELVDNDRPVVLGRIDVIHAEVGGRPQHCDGFIPIRRWAEDVGPCQAHGPETNRGYRKRA